MPKRGCFRAFFPWLGENLNGLRGIPARGQDATALRTAICQAISDPQGWDVLFFAGHSNEADAVAACAFPDDLLDNPELRTEETGGLASRVSSHPGVRKALFERQRAFAMQPGGAVLDGRDIGTVIAPDADVKLWVDAAVEVRAERRWKELRDKGEALSLDDMIAQLKERDHRDKSRPNAPMVAAADSILIDTTYLTIDAAVDKARAAVDAVIAQKSERSEL